MYRRELMWSEKLQTNHEEKVWRKDKRVKRSDSVNSGPL